MGERAFVAAFQSGLGYQVVVVSVHAGDGEGLTLRTEGDRGWPLPWRASHVDPVPLLGVAGVADGDVIVLAPEEWDCVEAFALAEDVAGGRLSLALREDPVLDAYASSGVRVGPASDIPRGVDPRRGGFQVLIDGHPAIDRESRLCSEIGAWADADAEHDEIGAQRGAVVEDDCARVDTRRLGLQVEHDPVLFVQRADVGAELGAEDTFEWCGLGGDDVDVEVSVPKGSRHLETNEAGADHDRALLPLRRGDDRAAVGPGAQCEDVRLVLAREIQANRLRTRRQEECTVGQAAIRFQDDLGARGIDHRRARADDIDVVLFVEPGRPQRHPFVLRRAGQVVLGEIGAIVGRVGLGVDDGDRSDEPFTPEHFRRGSSRGTRTDDHDGLRRCAQNGRSIQPGQRVSLGAFGRDEPAAVAPFDIPACDRVERGGAECGAGPKAEAGVVQRAADRVADE